MWGFNILLHRFLVISNILLSIKPWNAFDWPQILLSLPCGDKHAYLQKYMWHGPMWMSSPSKCLIPLVCFHFFFYFLFCFFISSFQTSCFESVGHVLCVWGPQLQIMWFTAIFVSRYVSLFDETLGYWVSSSLTFRVRFRKKVIQGK